MVEKNGSTWRRFSLSRCRESTLVRVPRLQAFFGPLQSRGLFVVRGNRERGSTRYQRSAQRATAPLDDCVVARLRSADQLFRPGKFVRFSRRPSFYLRHHHRPVRLPAERLQLDLRPAATSLRRTARPLWSPLNRPNQLVPVVCSFLRSGSRHCTDELSF